MAEGTKPKTIRETFDEALDILIGGIKKLNGAGVTNDKAAELVGVLHRDAIYAVNAASAPQGMPPAAMSAGPFQLGGSAFPHASTKEGEKAYVLALLKQEGPKLGITADDLANLYDEPEAEPTPKPKTARGAAAKTPPAGDPATTAAGGASGSAPAG